jgi:hypothetical protein
MLPRDDQRALVDDFERFWAPYIQSSEDPIIQTASRRFLAIGDTLYIRDVRTQQGGEIDDFLRQLGIEPQLLSQEIRARIRRSRHFVSSGETEAMLQLADAFLTRDRSIRFGNLPRYGKSRGNANLIQVGLPRIVDNLTVYRMIQGEGLYLTRAGVARRQPETAGQNRVEDVPFPETEFRGSKLDPFDDTAEEADRFVIVTRVPNSDECYSLTAVTSNHGRATEAVCRLLSDKAKLKELIDRLAPSGDDLPSRFQVVFKVSLVRQEEGEIEKTDPTIVEVVPQPEHQSAVASITECDFVEANS